jgi:hypothetical protein
VRATVRVAGAHEPQRDARRPLPPQPRDDRLARRLVAVHVADHEHAHGRIRLADTRGRDGAPLDGVAEEERDECGGREHRRAL